MRKITILSACISLMLCLTACITIDAAVDKKGVRPKDFGSPEEKTLIYGSMRVYSIPITIMEFMQMNPKNEAKFVKPKTFSFGFEFYFPPADKGDIYNLIFLYASGGNVVYKGDFGLQAFARPVFVADKPGLKYAGAYKIDYIGSGFVFSEDEEVKEAEILKRLKRDFKGTAWESLIDSRIEELEE